MSKASEWADKISVARMIATQQPLIYIAPATFSATEKSRLNIFIGISNQAAFELSADQALQLRDWLTETFED